MSYSIIGTLIFSSGKIQVTQHDLGFTVTDGERVRVLSTMPTLSENLLTKFLNPASSRELSPYEKWQFKNKGNVILETPSNDERSIQECDAESFAERLAEHIEMQMDDHWNY